MSYYVHDIPGRLRVKTPSIKGNHMSAREIEGLVNALPGIVSVTTNPVTGSVVVNYDSTSINSKEILNMFRKEGYWNPSETVGGGTAMQDTLSQTTSRFIGKALLGLLIEKAFEGSPLALLSVII